MLADVAGTAREEMEVAGKLKVGLQPVANIKLMKHEKNEHLNRSAVLRVLKEPLQSAVSEPGYCSCCDSKCLGGSRVGVRVCACPGARAGRAVAAQGARAAAV